MAFPEMTMEKSSALTDEIGFPNESLRTNLTFPLEVLAMVKSLLTTS